MSRILLFCVIVVLALNFLIVATMAATNHTDVDISENVSLSQSVTESQEPFDPEPDVLYEDKRPPVRPARPTRSTLRPRRTRPAIGTIFTLRPRADPANDKSYVNFLSNMENSAEILKSSSKPTSNLPDVSSVSPAIIDKGGLESSAEQTESEAELLTDSKTTPTERNRPPRSTIALPQSNNALLEEPKIDENSVLTTEKISSSMSPAEPAIGEEAEADASKIFVNPNNNAVNFTRPPRIKPTTEQIEFEAGVPPGWTKPPSQPPRPTRRTRPTRPTRPTRRAPYSPIRLTSEPEHQENNTLGKPATVENSTLSPVNNASTYPPGVSPPEPTITDPDRGVVDWLLGLVGIKPNPDNPGPSSSGPAKGCSKCVCGLTYKHNRIVGGVETQVNEYPWMVVLMYNNRFYCGASLINNKYLLTAGHCVNGFTKDRLSAVFLDHDRSTNFETKTFSRKISKILKHRSYGTGGSYNNDIALLQLDEEVPFSGLIKPVCLPPTGKSYSGYKGIVTGWGATQAHGSVSNKLREVEVPILSNVDCQKTGYGQRITDNMLCAGYSYGTKDSCQGDSGGPLHVVDGTNHIIIGIVSWGEGCAEPNYPGVYTRVNRYISWIQSNTRDACYC